MRKFLTFLLLTMITWVSSAQIVEPAHWSYSVKELDENRVELQYTVKLDAGWHIYSQHTDPNGPLPLVFTLTPDKAFQAEGGVKEPKSHDEYDATFGCTVRSFSGKATFRQVVKRKTEKAFKVKGVLSFQLCNDGSCIAPSDIDYSFNVKALDAEKAAAFLANTNEEKIDTATVVDTASPVELEKEVPKDEATTMPNSEKSLLGIFLVAILGGIATMFTPCVFPMIPMTVNFFMHGSDNKRKNRRQAWIFGFSIVFIFAVLGALLTLFFGPESLNFIGTHWIPNLIFFIIFIVFSLSFFGLFEIRMPEKWINASDEQADKGGWLAPFFIALTTVLVSFSCTGPIIGTALVGLATSTANRWVSLLTMLGFGIGFALPFTLLAMFPSVLQNMKSGSWLNTVKVVFAFLELAFGLKFLSMADLYCGWRLLDREVYLALWIVIFALLGFYLLGKLRFKGDDEVKQLSVVRLFLAIASLAFTMYLIPGMWGAPLKGVSGFIPPMDTQDFNIEKLVLENGGSQNASTIQFAGELPTDRKYADKLHMPVGFEGFYDLDEAKAYAKKVGKPIFIDFTGRNCANCREMEQSAWVDPEAKKLLNEGFVMCAMYADMNSIELPENEWVKDDNGRIIKTLGRRNLNYQTKHYNTNAQPYYVIIDSEGNVLTKENFKYQKDISKFVAYLQEGIETFKK